MKSMCSKVEYTQKTQKIKCFKIMIKIVLTILFLEFHVNLIVFTTLLMFLCHLEAFVVLRNFNVLMSHVMFDICDVLCHV